MPSLDEIRGLFREEDDDEGASSEFNGKLNLSGKMIARAIYESLPAPVKECMEKVEGVCVAGGYIRDKLNGTKPRDIDLWIYGLDEPTRANRLTAAKIALTGPCKFRYESKYTFSFVTGDNREIQLIKRTGMTPWRIIEKFDFYCCKFAVYLKNGRPLLKEEKEWARRHALKKVMVPIRDLEEPGSVLRHTSKLHRRGYRIEERHLYEIMYKYEKSMPDDYGA